MENNSVLLIRLQDLLHRLRSSRNSRLHLIREIRKKVTTFELLLHKVLNLELYLEKVPGTSFQTALGLGFGSNETTYAEPQKIPPPPPPIFQNDITRPFSYSQSKALRDLVLLLRRNPRDLAKILVAVSFANEEVKGGNSDKKIAWSSLDTDRICRMVVFDIYEPEISHRELIILIEEVLTSSYHGFSKGTRKGSRSMSPEAELLRPNTMTALLLKHYLNRFGVKYLKDVLRYQIDLL